MSTDFAREALTRMNLREIAISTHLATFESDLTQLARANPVEQAERFEARKGELAAAYGLDSSPAQRKAFAFSNGVAIIPISGTLINRFGYSWGFVTGYNFIRQQTALAAADPDVDLIVYDVNSFGGEAAGCFECAADMKRLAAQGGKPTVAVVDSNAYSAGYALASAADQIICTPSGGVGSIGVVAMHVDMSKMLDDIGIKVTFIHAGEFKVEGNPYEPLSKAAQGRIQKSVDKSYDAFVSLVATNREMSDKAVRATEAQIYRAEEAQELGLIDAVMSPNEAVMSVLDGLSGSDDSQLSSQEPIEMANTETKPGETQAAASAESLATARADAAKAERTRISGIQSCEEAKGREALASHLALKTDMSVTDAQAILAASPKTDAPVAAASKANAFDAAMNRSEHPNVGANEGTEQASGKPTEKEAVAEILQAYSAVSGRKLQVVGAK